MKAMPLASRHLPGFPWQPSAPKTHAPSFRPRRPPFPMGILLLKRPHPAGDESSFKIQWPALLNPAHFLPTRCWTRGKGLRSRYVDTFSHDASDFTPPVSPLALHVAITDRQLLGSFPPTPTLMAPSSDSPACFSFFQPEAPQHPTPDLDNSTTSQRKSPFKAVGGMDPKGQGEKLPWYTFRYPYLYNICFLDEGSYLLPVKAQAYS